jgi:hypothetical protein
MTNYTYTVAIPQPLEMTNCVYILAQPSELAVMPQLTASQGTELAISIAGLWAIAYVFRVCITLLKSNNGDPND